MHFAQRLIAEALAPTIERTVNAPGLKQELGIPEGISFKVTVTDEFEDSSPDSIPIKTTAVGEGFTAEQLYDAEWKLQAKIEKDMPMAQSRRIMDH